MQEQLKALGLRFRLKLLTHTHKERYKEQQIARHTNIKQLPDTDTNREQGEVGSANNTETQNRCECKSANANGNKNRLEQIKDEQGRKKT